jgi:hypothetical protein
VRELAGGGILDEVAESHGIPAMSAQMPMKITPIRAAAAQMNPPDVKKFSAPSCPPSRPATSRQLNSNRDASH